MPSNNEIHLVDLALTLKQYKSLKDDSLLFEVMNNLYVLKNGKKVVISDFPQLKNAYTFPYNVIYAGLWHDEYAWQLEMLGLDPVTLESAPYSSSQSFKEHLSRIRKEFEQEIILQFTSNKNDVPKEQHKSNVRRFMRYLASTRSLPLGEAILDLGHYWLLDQDYLDNFLITHSFALSLQLDDHLISNLYDGMHIWLPAYTICKAFQVHLKSIRDNRYSSDNDKKITRLGLKSDKSLRMARARSITVRREKKERDEEKRIAFAEDLLVKNPSLSAKDIASRYKEKNSETKYKLSTLVTYFQKSRATAIKNLIVPKRK